MKYSFALAALLAVYAIDGASAIQIAKDAEKTAEEKDEALKAKLEVKKAEKEALDEKAVKAETKAMNDAESEKDRGARYLREVYNKNINDQKEEAAWIKKLRTRPADSKPMEGHDPAVNTATSALEHWTMNMPEHIITNKEGPTAAWNTPMPPKLSPAAEQAIAVEKAAEAKAPKA